MRTGLLTMLLTLAALNAGAKISAFIVDDPLTGHIKDELARGQGQITGGSRGASGQITPIKIVDPLSFSVAAEPLRDAVANPNALAVLKPAAGLTVKTSKKRVRSKYPRASKKQLIKISGEKQW